MSGTIKIQDLTSRLNIDTSKAMKAIADLQKAFNKLGKEFNKSFDGSKLKNAKKFIEDTEDSTKKLKKGFLASYLASTKLGKGLAKVTDKLGEIGKKIPFKHLAKSARKATNNVNGFRTSLGAMVTATGAVSLLYSLRDGFNSVADAGKRYKSAVMSLGTSIGGTELGRALSLEQLQAMTDKQRIFVANLSKRLGTDSTEGTNQFGQLFAAAADSIGGQTVRDIFTGFSEMSAVTGLSFDKQQRIMTAFTQMAAKNQVMAEELKNQLGDSLPASLNIFAKALTKANKFGEVTTENILNIVSSGKVLASDVLPFVAEEMMSLARANGNLERATKTVPFLSNVLGQVGTQAKIGIFNQFEKALGGVLEKLIAFADDPMIQTIIGTVISNLIQRFGQFLDKLMALKEQWQAVWDTMTDEEKQKALSKLTDFVQTGLIATFVAAASAVGRLVGGFGFLRGIAAILVGIFVSLGGAMFFMFGWVGVLILAVTTLGTVFALTFKDSIGKSIKWAWDQMKGFKDWIMSGFTKGDFKASPVTKVDRDVFKPDAVGSGVRGFMDNLAAPNQSQNQNQTVVINQENHLNGDSPSDVIAELREVSNDLAAQFANNPVVGTN